MTAGDAWDDLAEWIAYLKESGVRDLVAPIEVGPAAPRSTRPAAKPGPPAAPPAPCRAEPARPPAAGRTKPARPTAPPPAPAADSPLGLIREDLGDCTRCKLHAGRNKIVFGVGNPQAKLLFVGEGPGADEDARGEPFVGRAGKKLDEMIASIGLSRAEVYIANIVKCRPPNNRDPASDEIATCFPFLVRQIEAIAPKAIVALGSPAAKTLLNTSTGITRLRGNWHDFRGIPVMPTFHPAYLLRSYTRENRTKVWEDLKAARARIDE